MNYIISKFILKIKLFDILIKLECYALIIYISNLFIKRIEKKYNNSNINVLALGRSIFNEDIENISKHSKNISYIVIDKVFFTQLFLYLCPQLMYSHNDYYDNLKLKNDNKNIKIYKKIANRILKKLKINAIISANYNYSWQQPIYEICEELAIKKIILFKEGIAPLRRPDDSKDKAMKEMLLRFTNHNFNSDLLMVYNQTVKKAFLDSNIVNPSSCKVKVCGIPRFDRYTKMKENKSEDLKRIVFFSFSIFSKTDFLKLSKVNSRDCLNYMDYFHLEIIKFAINNPSIELTIKTKSNPKFLHYINNLINNNYKICPGNITITNSQSVYSLIEKSKYVIGFNSTTMLQALMANRIVFSADFSKFGINDIFHEEKNIVYKVDSSYKLNNLITKINSNSNSNSPSIIKPFLEERVGPIDGKSSERANKYIEDLVINN